MKITGFLWLENIVEKLQKKHDVFCNEVEEVFANKPRFRFVEKGHRSYMSILLLDKLGVDVISSFFLSTKQINEP